MKFGQKIFLIAFILIIVSINMIGIMMINNNYKTNMELQIDKGIMQINTIANNLDLYNASNIIFQIANQYLQDNIYIEIYIAGNLFYTNLKEDYTQVQQKLNNITTDEIKVYIQDKQLFIKIDKSPYVIMTKTDITQIYTIKDSQIDFFTKISLAISLVIAFILSISVFFATRRIQKLSKVAKEITKGNYDTVIQKMGKDEIGELGETFNHMANSVKENVETINQVSENRKKFIGNLTHEIRTPLTSIIGYSSLMKNKKITENSKIVEYSEKIYEEGNYIKEMSDKLMNLVLLENKKIDLEMINLSKELFKISKVLEDTFTNVKFELAIAKDVHIQSDKILLKSLVTNLVKNSINAYQKNPIVSISLDENAIIKIVDFGKGISKEELEKIKDPFYTVNKNRNRQTSGMGLGIPLCMRIIEIHQGKLDIQSQIGVGTQITIQLGEIINEKN